MMSDPAASIPMPSMINSILSECVWGRVTPGEVPKWTMISPSPSSTPTEPGGVSYGEFLENVLRVSREERKKIKTHFTEPGHIGEVCREHYLKLMKKMESLPPTQLVMPSFFHLVIELERRKLDFGIVFRTFGSDCEDIVKEFNEFCRAPHSVCNSEDVAAALSSKCVDVDVAIGKITRGGGENGEEESFLLEMGSVNEKECIVNGGKEIFSHVYSMIFDHNKRSLMIQDDYPYWNKCGETDDSGKLLLIDSDNDSVVQIFFDDNIERDRAHIIDVRKLPGLERVPFEEANDVHYLRVSPHEIISDDTYFIRTFDEVLSRRNI
eukprot:CAMPEP_0114427126 /NCGR_PEP_ID=MMETSP0103-20121206/8173_1 /TAXON_ID=37642 ORGANISM="Paraphysomonas imperforata, Strain PA2" /NCGR_SAMPLE_ID=MMETSP0103 /ASSEMBLY_ACC=CAM_ASM_000201 /LENGTH=322 /DNA_ID=CAMNT_0001596149 /DNA_START=1601 /DNA_END=2569 /DNA_ORIENTATION=+